MLKMSQLSMDVRQTLGGTGIAMEGKLPKICIYDGRKYLTTVLLAHFECTSIGDAVRLRHLTIAALPNGLLQERYNPTVVDTIWRADGNPTRLGEDTRAELSFPALVSKAPWRVQRISYDETGQAIPAGWSEAAVGVPTIEGENHC